MRPSLLGLLGLSIATQALAQDGSQLYTLYCSACHGVDGKGASEGTFPPLAGSRWVAGEPDRAIKTVIHGIHGPIRVNHKDFNLEMPPQGAVLPDDQIAASKRARLVIPAGTYTGEEQDIVTTSLPVAAFTTTKMDDDTAYALTKTFWESKAKMGADAAWWNGVDQALMANITGKIHPGAQRYYAEAGIELTDTQK